MRLDTAKLVKTPELTRDHTDYHKHNRFYSPKFLDKPEFVYRNHLTKMKDADMELLEQALANDEAEESKRNLLNSQDGLVS
jgi:mannitol-1-phosphate/altronate dehydrogenase